MYCQCVCEQWLYGRAVVIVSVGRLLASPAGTHGDTHTITRTHPRARAAINIRLYTHYINIPANNISNYMAAIVSHQPVCAVTT